MKQATGRLPHERLAAGCFITAAILMAVSRSEDPRIWSLPRHSAPMPGRACAASRKAKDRRGGSRPAGDLAGAVASTGCRGRR